MLLPIGYNAMRIAALHEESVRRLIRALFYREDMSVFSVLQIADYRNLWIGQFISVVGDALAYNTLTFAILGMAKDAGEKSGSYLATLAVLSALPSLLIGMIAGTVVDRANRKYIMIGSDIIRGFLALGFLVVHDLDHVWLFYCVSICMSAVSTFFYPARTALMPQILTKKQLLAANALGQLTITLSFVIGAAIAGFMVGQTDTKAPAFIADSLSFFVSAFFIARITISGKIVRQHVETAVTTAASSLSERIRRGFVSLRTMYQELMVGLRYVLTDQVMRGVLISFLALFLGLGAANVTFVPLLIDELHMKEEGLGLIRLTQSLGIILGSAATTAIAARYKARNIIGISMLLFGITTFIVAITPNYALMVLVLFAVGIAIAPPQIVAPTLMQRHVPSERLGRASSAQGTIVTVANILSMGAAGYLMDHIGAREIFMASGILIFSAGLVSRWVLRGVEDVPEEVAVSN
jgi:MFS family permease